MTEIGLVFWTSMFTDVKGMSIGGIMKFYRAFLLSLICLSAVTSLADPMPEYADLMHCSMRADFPAYQKFDLVDLGKDWGMNFTTTLPEKVWGQFRSNHGAVDGDYRPIEIIPFCSSGLACRTNMAGDFKLAYMIYFYAEDLLSLSSGKLASINGILRFSNLSVAANPIETPAEAAKKASDAFEDAQAWQPLPIRMDQEASSESERVITCTL